MYEAAEQFREAIQSAGLSPPEVIEPDGKLHRFASNGTRGDDAGWYVLHGDGVAAGAFGDWRTGASQTWRANIGRKLSPAEDAAHRGKIEAMRREREAEEARRQADAAAGAAAIWEAARPAPADHPYLLAKGIALNGARLQDDRLLIPLRADGAIHSLQFIAADGGKRFLPGGRVPGCYFSIGNLKGAAALCIAEGFATGASIHEATGYPVAVAFNAGNLLAVAKAMRGKFPELRLILCADDDYRTEGNPGRTKAIEAAQAVGGLLALPDFGANRPEGATDFNDLHRARGAEAVKATIEAAAPAGGESSPDGEYALDVNLIRGCDIRPEPVEWIWGGWLAAGKMHILGGAPGTGKTTLALALAATLTSGGRWPGGVRSTIGNAVVWSGEDDPADTLIPRLALSGADLSRVYFIGDVREGSERRSFDPARDMEPLRRKLVEIGGARLLIVDPIVSAIAGDSHKNAEVRRGLQPLADLAASMRCALLGITHFSKGTGGRDPVERLTGSLAFGALARVVLVAAKRQEEGEDGRTMRLFCRAKSNIGPDDGGFEYDLSQAELKTHPGIFASSVLWGEAVEGAARELLATAEMGGEDGEGGTLADAKRFLADLLSGGPRKAGEVFRDADGAGYSKRSIQRAADKLGVDRRKEGMRGGWVWALPKMPNPPEGAEDARTKCLAPTAPSAASSLVEVEI
jgi:putative DNA primase/helicase